jgi:hypothetical protein
MNSVSESGKKGITANQTRLVTGSEEEKATPLTILPFLVSSSIEKSHKKPVTDLLWLNQVKVRRSNNPTSRNCLPLYDVGWCGWFAYLKQRLFSVFDVFCGWTSTGVGFGGVFETATICRQR